MGDMKRRDLLRAGAWTLPVIAVAAATPAATASDVGAYDIVIRSASQAGSFSASSAVITGYVYLRGTTTFAPVQTLTITFLPSLIVVTTTANGFFYSLEETGNRQTSYQITAEDGSTTGLRPF
ncbi:MAG: hypothetical protein Q7T71_15680 [Herbiconiux sp.]|nr:hypothetical protein [Herbiconiux sp.]